MKRHLLKKLIFRSILITLSLSALIFTSIDLSDRSNNVTLDTPSLSFTKSGNSITLNYSKISGATSYRIFTNRNNGGWKLLKVNPNNVFSFSEDFSDNSEKCNRYRVIAVHSTGDSFIYSEYSNIVTLVGIMQKPAFVNAEKITDDNAVCIKVSWTPSATASGYQIYRIINNKTMEVVTTTSYKQTEIIDKDLESDNKYVYKIRAVNFWVNGDSLKSDFSDSSNQIYIE